MPELPEVERARSLIADRALHRRIVDVDDSDSYVTRPHPSGELRSALTGRSLTAAYRRGKTIWVETSGTGDAAARDGPELGIHLGMSGRIAVTGPDGTVTEGGDPRTIVEARGLKQVTDIAAIEKVVDDIVSKNPDKVADAKTNPKAIGWFVGQVMKASGGKANPQAVNDLLKAKLGL